MILFPNIKTGFERCKGKRYELENKKGLPEDNNTEVSSQVEVGVIQRTSLFGRRKEM